MTEEKCTVCRRPIMVQIFRGTGLCSVVCRKEAGLDVPSVGTMMFVTTEEKSELEAKRNGGNDGE